ncbi:MAG: Gfo/Idh/MocA family oxidoreductase [bacterium]|nr:Gfo/Idh/MocA family oxidoreductase [bacterium]
MRNRMGTAYRTRRPTRRFFLGSAMALPVAGQSNEGVGVLAIGVRGRGRAIGVLAGGHGRVVAACDVDEASYGRFFERLDPEQPQRPELYRDYRQALERNDVDVVTVGTPDHWHTRIVLDALHAGKDVYAEKPLTLTVDEGKRIRDAVRETGRVMQVGTQQRTEFEQRFLKAVAIARSGRLGKKLKATCFIGKGRAGGPFPVVDAPSTLDWKMWLGPAPDVEFVTERCHGTFRWWFHYSGGKLTDWGAHHIDIAHWALGLENTGPLEIRAKGKFPIGRKRTLDHLLGKIPAQAMPTSYNTVTEFRVRIKFAGGNRIEVRHGPGNGVLLEGAEGSLFVNRKELTGDVVRAIAADTNESARLTEEVHRLYGGEPPKWHMDNFIDCVKNRGRRPISDVSTHHRSVSSCHLANIAMLCGRKLRWDPEAEDSPGDAEASWLLKREGKPG